MEQVMGWLFPTVASAVIGIIGFFCVRTLTQFDKRVHELEKKQNDMLQNMPIQYVLRDDFIRTIARLDDKLDKILDKVSEGKAAGR